MLLEETQLSILLSFSAILVILMLTYADILATLIVALNVFCVVIIVTGSIH